MTWLVDPLRRLRQGRVALAGVALLVAITVFAAVAGPRLYERVSGESIRSAVLAIPPADRVVQLSEVDTGLPSQPRTFKDQSSAGAAVAHLFPGRCRRSWAAPSRSSRRRAPAWSRARHWPPSSGCGSWRVRPITSTWSAAGHPRARSRLSLTRSTRAAAAMARRPPRSPSSRPRSRTWPLTSSGLRRAPSSVLAPDPLLDPLAGGGAVGVTITGIFDVDSATDPYWTDDARVRGYTLREFSSNVTFVQTTLLLSPDAYGPLAFGTAMHGPSSGGYTIAQPALRVSWRYAADPSRIDPADLDPIVSALRRLQATYPILPLDASSPSIQTGLLRRLVGLPGAMGRGRGAAGAFDDRRRDGRLRMPRPGDRARRGRAPQDRGHPARAGLLGASGRGRRRRRGARHRPAGRGPWRLPRHVAPAARGYRALAGGRGGHRDHGRSDGGYADHQGGGGPAPAARSSAPGGSLGRAPAPRARGRRCRRDRGGCSNAPRAWPAGRHPGSRRRDHRLRPHDPRRHNGPGSVPRDRAGSGRPGRRDHRAPDRARAALRARLARRTAARSRRRAVRSARSPRAWRIARAC